MTRNRWVTIGRSQDGNELPSLYIWREQPRVVIHLIPNDSAAAAEWMENTQNCAVLWIKKKSQKRNWHSFSLLFDSRLPYIFVSKYGLHTNLSCIIRSRDSLYSTNVCVCIGYFKECRSWAKRLFDQPPPDDSFHHRFIGLLTPSFFFDFTNEKENKDLKKKNKKKCTTLMKEHI